MRPSERVSMNQISEVLDHAVEYLQHINKVIDEELASAPSQRVGMLLTAFAGAQQGLSDAIERYAEDATDRVLNTFVNFSAELPAAIAGPVSADSTLLVTQWLVGVNKHLYDLFNEVAGLARGEEVRIAFQGLASQVEAHERKLSKEYQRFEDL